MRTGVCRPFERFLIKLAQWNIVCSHLCLPSINIPRHANPLYSTVANRTCQSVVDQHRKKEHLTLYLHRKKNLFLTKVLPWYIWCRKNSIGSRSPPKKTYVYLFLATVLLWCMWLKWKINLTNLSPKKIYIFVFEFCGAQDLRKFLIGTRPHWKKKCFQLKCYRRARNLRNIVFGTLPPP